VTRRGSRTRRPERNREARTYGLAGVDRRPFDEHPSQTAVSSPPIEYVDDLRRKGFELRAELGRGLSGRVFRAEQIKLGRDVAIKFCDGPESRISETLRKRFEREAKLLAKVSHPNIPYVLTTGEVQALRIPYTVLEFVEGHRLRDELMKRQTMNERVALGIVLDLLGALGAAHQANIVHRDVSPENIMVGVGRCVLIDFSIGMTTKSDVKLPRATKTGDHLGRVEYMAPEQMRDMTRVDARCDLYAAGVVLLEMLSGSAKFARAQLDAQMANLSVELREVIKRSLQEDREGRFPSAAAFQDALRPFASGAGSLNSATTALCTNTKCPGAAWTQNGYYEGPAIYADSTEAFCGRCGGRLKRQCGNCGSTFRHTQFCEGCGDRWYEIPTCETCGSWLQEQDMGTDTKANCCTKGRRKRPRGRTQVPVPDAPPSDDDIPF
jgi:eukaryotic-like serine/threonine-protein kinase